jgi:succinyl-CoA synthetase beta subunit
MNIHEYQAKEILKSYGIHIPRGCAVKSARQAEKAYQKFACDCVLKAQVYAGGRGKAGGIKTVCGATRVYETAKELFKNRLVTAQTSTRGLPVKKLLVEEVIDVEKEYYLSFTLDRRSSRYCLIASAAGGMDIEEVARTAPEKIISLIIDPFLGVKTYHAREVCALLGLQGSLIDEGIKLIQILYKILLEKDCSLVEINPLAVTKDGRLLAMDCKINFDDNALFRHPDYEKMADLSQLDPLEIEARSFDLAYIKLNGNIGCMVNGAGLAMATLDILKEYGAEPANFLDVGGGASRDKVAAAFRIILSDKKVRGIFVNIFGGIMRCDIIAHGIIDATREISPHIPIVVRMDGSNLEEGIKLLAQSGLNVKTVDNLKAGVQKIAHLINKKK